MDPEAARFLSQGLMILSMVGSAIGEGMVLAAGFKAIGRNPKLEETLFSKMLITAAVVESTAIYAFVAFLISTFVA